MNLTNYKIKPNYTSGNLELIKISNEGKEKADKTKLISCTYKLDLAKAIYKYYNTGVKVALQFNRKIIYIGAINFELQTAGTYAQKNSYLQITLNKFLNKLLTKNKTNETI
tara:strand:- start:596 stop:928 length:333 start_codon:yes stop_codon:yes gene_type:complete